MKNYVILFSIFLVLTACNRAVVEPIVAEDVYFSQNKEAISRYSRIELAQLSKNIQIWTFDGYTETEKVALFKDKMQTILDQEILSEEKANVIEFVNDNLSENVFTDAAFYNDFIENLQTQIENANFTDEEIASIFFTIDDVTYENGAMRPYHFLVANDPGDGGGSDEQKPCNMEWCLTCGFTGGDYNCDSGCKPTLRGCGWFISQECTKICR